VIVSNHSQLTDSFDNYWSVGNQKTYSKLEALIWANGDIAKVQYHWMENTWDKVNFSIEPTQSWQELCIARARQIRDTHDWVCLWYSGGWDSAGVMQAFIDAKCPIDEIAVADWSHYYDDGEISHAFANANWYKTHINPSVVIRSTDLDFDHVDNWFNSNKNWITSPGDTIRFTRPNWGIRTTSNLDILKSKDRLNRAEVMGLEKPRLDIYNGAWRTFMPDTVMSNAAACGATQFYCSQHLPELHVKQVHMAIRFFELNKFTTAEEVHGIQSFKMFRNKNWYPEWNAAVGRSMPTNLNTAAGTQKTSNPPGVNAPMDKKIVEHAQSTNSNSFKIYNSGINQLSGMLPWWDPTSFNFSKANLCSKFYNVRPVNTV
jgi:hypothetical protein